MTAEPGIFLKGVDSGDLLRSRDKACINSCIKIQI